MDVMELHNTTEKKLNHLFYPCLHTQITHVTKRGKRVQNDVR